MSDDRWFRMCRDAGNYLERKVVERIEYVTVPVILNDISNGKVVNSYPNWTVDELIGMYNFDNDEDLEILQWVRTELNEKYLEVISISYSEVSTIISFIGHSWRDVWLQLVMWDKHEMIWDDEQSMWVSE